MKLESACMKKQVRERGRSSDDPERSDFYKGRPQGALANPCKNVFFMHKLESEELNFSPLLIAKLIPIPREAAKQISNMQGN
jgi:hypothetical protein